MEASPDPETTRNIDFIEKLINAEEKIKAHYKTDHPRLEDFESVVRDILDENENENKELYKKRFNDIASIVWDKEQNNSIVLNVFFLNLKKHLRSIYEILIIVIKKPNKNRKSSVLYDLRAKSEGRPMSAISYVSSNSFRSTTTSKKNFEL
jgi:hypothetical protein